MSIVTLRFFIFVGVILAEYWICPKKFRWAVLLAGGGYFMLANTQGNWAVCAVFAAETLLTWLAALAVRRLSGERQKTLMTAATVMILAAALILYKDLSFFVNNIRSEEHTSELQSPS